MELFEKTVSQKYEYQGKIINLRVDEVLLPNGNASRREVIEHPGGVCVLAADGDGSLLMVRQFRYPYQEVILELPAGKLERGEDPRECGIRELKEETGYVAETFEFLGKVYPSPGYVDEIIHLYLATGLRMEGQQLDPDEFLTVERIPLNEAVRLALDNQIPDAKSQVAILKYACLNGAWNDIV